MAHLDCHGERRVPSSQKETWEFGFIYLDHEVREALTSITQSNVDQKGHIGRPSDLYKRQAPGSHTPTQELPQDGFMPLCSLRAQPAEKQL